MSYKVGLSTIIDNNQDYAFQGGTFTGTLTALGGFNWGDVPVGIMHWYVRSDVSSSLPTGWAHCDGSAISRTTYADLFAVLGTQWGAGDGTTTFNLPDTDGHYIMGDSAAAVGTGPWAPQIGHHSHPSNTLAQKVNIPHTHTATAGAVNAPHSHTVNASSANNAPHNHTAATSANNMPHSHNGNTSNNGSHTHQVGTVDNSEVEASPNGNQNYGSKNATQRIPEGTQPAGGHSHNVNQTGANAPHSHPLSWPGNAPHSHAANTNAGNGPHTHPLTLGDADTSHGHSTNGTNINPNGAMNTGVELDRYMMRLIIKIA